MKPTPILPAVDADIGGMRVIFFDFPISHFGISVLENFCLREEIG